MADNKKKEIITFAFLVFSIFWFLPSGAQAQAIAVPTISSITATDNQTTTIKGTTAVNTDVMLFLDNKFVGTVATDLTSDSSTSIEFNYSLKNDLADGQHILSAIAHDSQTQTISDHSRPFIFIVSEKKEISIGTQIENEINVNLPSAPVLQDPPMVNNNGQLVITGWARNNYKINIFLDEKQLASFPVDNSETGTANFTYIVRQPLGNSGHLIFTTATDSSGMNSIRSNYLYFLNGGVKANELLLNGEQNNKANLTKNSDKNITGNKADQDLSDILGQKQAADKDKSGMVDESKEMQGKLKWNLIIFILFLIAVVAWIFWVNRELIKEKREQNKKPEEKNNQDKLV
jgi:hypothetical protein